MGRTSKYTISLLPSVRDQVGKFFNKVSEDNEEEEEEIIEFVHGVIVGQTYNLSGGQQQNESDCFGYMIHLARTPVEVKQDEGEESEGEVVKSIEQVGVEWVVEHAKQVTNMLSGGMQVLGIFVVSRQESSLTFKAPKVRSCIEKIHASLHSSGVKKDCEYVVLHVNLEKAAYEAELLSTCSSTTNKPLEFREETKDFQFISVSAKLLLDYPVVFMMGEFQDQPLAKKFFTALKKIETNLEKSSFLFNDTFRTNLNEYLDESLNEQDPSANGGRPKLCDPDGAKEETTSNKEYSAQILLDPELYECGENVETLEISSRMRVSGRMAVRVFLHPRATVGDAIFAIKEDVLRSLNTRATMHCDSLVGEDAGGTEDEIPVLHEAPRRVLIRLPNSDISISDFLFPGVPSEASVDAVKEVFGFHPDFEDIDDELELVASPKQVITAEGDEANERTTSTLATSVAASNCNVVFVILSVMVVILSAAVSYFYTQGGHEDSMEEEEEEDSGPMDHLGGDYDYE